jgi:hypothetical protein
LVAKFEPFFSALCDSPWTVCPADKICFIRHEGAELPKGDRTTLAKLLSQAPELCLA